VLGPGASERMDDDDDAVTFATRDTQSTVLLVASELSPRVSMLEAELENYRRRFENDVVPADEVVAVPSPNTHVDSKCCIIL